METHRVSYDMVGWKQCQHRLRICALQDKSGEADGWRRVATHWFGDHLVSSHLGELTQDLRLQVVVRDHPNLLGSRELKQSRDRLLDHCLLAIEREQLLGPFHPA